MFTPEFLLLATVIMLFLTVVIFLFLTRNLLERVMKNGKIELRLSEFEKEKDTIRVTHTDLVLKISYHLKKNPRYNKEQSAILICDMVRSECALRGFKVTNKMEKTLKEIKEIMESIKPLCSHETDSDLTSIDYTISAKTITN